MTLAILTLLGTLASLAFWLIRRRASKVDDPNYQHEQRDQLIRQAIVKGDAPGLNLALAQQLDKLRDQAGATGNHSGGSGANPANDKPGV